MNRSIIHNPKVDSRIKKDKQWSKEFEALREIVLSCGLTEELKWGQACYTLGDKNIVLIHGFKEYCALLFMKGAILPDPKHILIQQTSKVQAARQVRFRSLAEIMKMKAVLKRYVKNAIAVEKSGKKIPRKADADYELPEEFKDMLRRDTNLREAFEALTPGRQHAYIYYFSAPKQSKTRLARIEKYTDRILDGLGMLD